MSQPFHIIVSIVFELGRYARLVYAKDDDVFEMDKAKSPFTLDNRIFIAREPFLVHSSIQMAQQGNGNAFNVT